MLPLDLTYVSRTVHALSIYIKLVAQSDDGAKGRLHGKRHQPNLRSAVIARIVHGSELLDFCCLFSGYRDFVMWSAVNA